MASPSPSAIETAIASAFAFVGRLLRTAVLLTFRPRRSIRLIRDRLSGSDDRFISDTSFLLVTCLFAGIRLRVSPTIVGELTLKHFHEFARELGNVSIISAMLGALPLMAGSVLVARVLAIVVTRNRDDQRFLEAVLRYALAESYLLSLILGALPALLGSLLSALPIQEGDFSPPQQPGLTPLIIGLSFALGGTLLIYALSYFIVPVLLPALSIIRGVRLLQPAGRRRRTAPLMLAAAAIVAMPLIPSIAGDFYEQGDGWGQGASQSVSVALRSGPPTLTDSEASCPACPSITIPVVFVNRGTAAVTVARAMIHMKGKALRNAIRSLVPGLDCEYIVYGGSFTLDGAQGLENEIIPPGGIRSGRVTAHIPTSVLHKLACEKGATSVRAAATPNELAPASTEDFVEVTSPWQGLEGICSGAQALPPDIAYGQVRNENVLPLMQTVLEGFAFQRQCRFRALGLLTRKRVKPEEVMWLFTSLPHPSASVRRGAED